MESTGDERCGGVRIFRGMRAPRPFPRPVLMWGGAWRSPLLPRSLSPDPHSLDSLPLSPFSLYPAAGGPARSLYQPGLRLAARPVPALKRRRRAVQLAARRRGGRRLLACSVPAAGGPAARTPPHAQRLRQQRWQRRRRASPSGVASLRLFTVTVACLPPVSAAAAAAAATLTCVRVLGLRQRLKRERDRIRIGEREVVSVMDGS